VERVIRCAREEEEEGGGGFTISPMKGGQGRRWYRRRSQGDAGHPVKSKWYLPTGRQHQATCYADDEHVVGSILLALPPQSRARIARGAILAVLWAEAFTRM
jgi:hypothetical protein